jgi:hypothetical protein
MGSIQNDEAVLDQNSENEPVEEETEEETGTGTKEIFGE